MRRKDITLIWIVVGYYLSVAHTAEGCTISLRRWQCERRSVVRSQGRYLDVEEKRIVYFKSYLPLSRLPGEDSSASYRSGADGCAVTNWQRTSTLSTF